MNKTIILFLFILMFFGAFGQDTTYYDIARKEVNNLQLAHYYEIDYCNQNKRYFKRESFYLSNQTRSEEIIIKRKGTYKEWYENGQLKLVTTENKKGSFNGVLTTYWPNGITKRNDIYRKGKWLSGNCYSRLGEKIPHYEYYVHAEFPGGPDSLYKYLRKNIENQASEINCKSVEVSYYVNKNGEISDAKITKSVNEGIDQEALRVVNGFPPFTPTICDGDTIAHRIILVIGSGFFR